MASTAAASIAPAARRAARLTGVVADAEIASPSKHSASLFRMSISRT